MANFCRCPSLRGSRIFPSACDDLTRVYTGDCLGFLFVSLTPTLEFYKMLTDLPDMPYGYDPGKLRLTSTRDYEVNAHWALYCENYLEGFHIPYVHQALNQIVDYGTYKTELFRFTSYADRF